MKTLISAISQTIAWQPIDENWINEKDNRLHKLTDLLPHGSGIDQGCKILPESTKNKIILLVPFHFMDDNGYYDGWKDYKIIVKPDLSSDFDFRIIGRDKRNIKEYLYDTFAYFFTLPVDIFAL